jgi:hypothetical protein
MHEVEKSIISAGYRQLAKKAHPDAGGSDKAMIALNSARDRLLSAVSAAPPRPAPPPQPTVPYTPTFDIGNALNQAAEAFAEAVFDEMFNPYSPRKRRRPRK